MGVVPGRRSHNYLANEHIVFKKRKDGTLLETGKDTPGRRDVKDT